MMGLNIVVLSLFGAALGGVVWWVWTQRQQAERQRQEAEERARMAQELARIGRSVQGIAHDISNLTTVVASSAAEFGSVSPQEIPDMVRELSVAAASIRKLSDALHGKKRPGGEPSTVEGIARMEVALHRREGLTIYFTADGDFPFAGDDVDAVRVVQNLVANAAREATAAGGEVRVRLSRAGLRVTNRVRDPSALDDRIYADGVSGSGSTGMGLANAVAAARRVGWRIRHEVQGADVTFVVEPGAPA